MLGLSFMLVNYNANSQDWQMLESSKSSTETKINLLTSTDNQINLEFEFAAYALDQVTTAKGMAKLINIPNCSRTQIKGAPDLPKISQAVAIPDISGMELKVVKSKFIEIDGLDIAPSRGVLSRDKDPKSIPYEYGEVYSKNEFYPANIVTTNDPYIIRNVRGQNIIVSPVQYNPVTKKVRIYTKLTLELVASEKTSKNVLIDNPNITNDEVFQSVLSNHFINYTPASTKYTPVSESGKNMLIVCYSDFMDEMAEFVTWKESIGYTVNMVDYSTIGSSSALETYVQNQYDQNGISYLLLVGDHAQVPSSSTSAGDSDNNYGYTSGSDHYLDIFVGRFSAENTTQLQTQIDRTIYYERDVNSSDSWFKNGVGIASNEGGTGGDDDESDEIHMDNIQTDLEGFGYSMDKVYQDGGSASQLSSILNNGCGIINYVGHGSDYTWASMVYTQSNVDALTNENELPFVISVACVVGNFTSKTCFAETWLRATNNDNPTGAIVYCGSTINQSWSSPMCAQDEMNDLLVAGTYINYGGMFVNGMFQMIDEYGSDGENMADTWTVFGDPSLQMRTPGTPEGPDSNGGVVVAPVAAFSTSLTTITAGESVTFSDQSTNSPTEYSWTFEGGTPATSTEKTPTVTYNTIGNYDVSLTVTNSAGTDTETKTNYITVDEYVATYCESKGNDFSYEWISEVQIGAYSNSSNGAAYTDFTSENITLEAGSAVSVSLTPGFASSSYNEYWKIWIDYNNDKDFDDANELVFDPGSMSSSTVTGTMNILSTASGTTRMRVSMKYNAAQTACETFTYGEVEDYTVTFGEVIDDQAPTAPTSLSSSNITQTTFTLSWNASSDNVGVTAYDVYKDGVLLVSTANTSYNVTNLTASTTYSFYVKAKDAEGNISTASSALSVTTDEPDDVEAPTAPTNLASSNVTETSATLSWTASTDNVGVVGYDVYRNGSYIANTTGTSYTATGLSASTTYTFYVKAKDAMGLESNASNTVSVTTDDVTAEYCESKGSNSSYEWISEVVIGTYSNESGAAGYTDFTSENITLEAGSSVNISLTPGFSGSTYDEYWKIWIDYNNDAVFADSELAFDGGSLSKTTVSGTMNILASASGTTRMRVSMKYNAAQTACETFTYGEVEDYTVTFGDAIPDTEAPTVPTGLSASNITNSSATISWTASNDNVGVTGYDVFRNGTYVASVASTSYSASGLSASTTYSFTVKAKDDSGNISAASSGLSVTTSDVQLTYCDSKGNNSSYEWIDLVELGSMSNATGNDGGYADYTNLSATVSKGASTTINFSCGFNSSSYTEYWHVWIDWDQSGTFDSDEEMVSGSSSSDATLSGTFTVPSDALSGSTRMRVTMKYNATATACETFTYGEVEDYTINVVSAAESANARALNSGYQIGNEAPTSVNVYPSPAANYINVNISNGSKIGTISIYNMIGSLVKVVEINGIEREINISELPAGSYIISVEDEKGPIVKQFIKQ